MQSYGCYCVWLLFNTRGERSPFVCVVCQLEARSSLSSPHALSSLLERREGLPEQADAVLVVLAVLHEQDVQLVLDLVRHDGVEVVVGRVAVGRLERARLGVGVSEARGWSGREGSGEGQVEAC